MKSCKNKKNINLIEKRGITFLILAITITFILIITSTLAISFFNVVESTNKKEFANEIYSVQKLVEQYEFINGNYPIVEEPIVFSLSRLDAEEKEQFKSEPSYDNNEIILKEINLVEAGADSITRGVRRNDNELDLYVVSEQTGKVYYLKGEEYDSVTYYTLTDSLKENLGV